MKVNGLTTKGKVLDNPFSGKAVTAYCAGLAVCFSHKVTLIQPEVYLGNTLLDIYHIKIICEYLWKDTTQQLLGLHDAKITNTYEIMCMRGREGCNWVLRLTHISPTFYCNLLIFSYKQLVINKKGYKSTPLKVIRMGLEPMTPTLKVLCSTS